MRSRQENQWWGSAADVPEVTTANRKSLELVRTHNEGHSPRMPIVLIVAQHSFNKSLTDVGKMLDERSVQTVSMPSNISKNKENLVSMLNEITTQFKFVSKHFQQAFNNVERPVQTPPKFGSTTVLNAC